MESEREFSVENIFLFYGLNNWLFSGVIPQDRERWKVWDNIGKSGMIEDSNFKSGHGDSEVTLRLPKEHIK